MVKLHADEPDIDERLVRVLVDDQFPDHAGLPLEPIEAVGTGNAIYRLGAELAVRIPRIERAAQHILKECRWLPLLGPQLPLAVPEPVGIGRPGHGFPWIWTIHRWLDGDSATADRIELATAAVQLAEFVRALRRIDITDAPPASRGRPLHTREAETYAAIDQLAGLIDTHAATDAWRAALAVPQWDGPPNWVHADLHAGNLLCQDDLLSAVIDFGSCGVGDPACDLMVAWTLLSGPAREIFRAELAADDHSWERGRGWALTFGLVALPYYLSSNPALAEISLRTVQAALTDRRPDA